MSGKIQSKALKPRSRKRLTVTKVRHFRTSETVGKQRDGMRTRSRREEFKRRSVSSKCHFLDADARLYSMRERHACDE